MAATETTTVEEVVSTTVEVDSVAFSASFFAFFAAEETKGKIKVMEGMLPRLSLLNPMMFNNHNQWDMEDNQTKQSLLTTEDMEVHHNNQWDTEANHNQGMDNNHKWVMEVNLNQDNTQLQLLTTIDQINNLR